MIDFSKMEFRVTPSSEDFNAWIDGRLIYHQRMQTDWFSIRTDTRAIQECMHRMRNNCWHHFYGDLMKPLHEAKREMMTMNPYHPAFDVRPFDKLHELLRRP